MREIRDQAGPADIGLLLNKYLASPAILRSGDMTSNAFRTLRASDSQAVGPDTLLLVWLVLLLLVTLHGRVGRGKSTEDHGNDLSDTPQLTCCKEEKPTT